MKLITFSGVDGSGKSSQLDRLKTSLEQTGHAVFYFHAIEHSLAHRVRRFLKRSGPFVPGNERAVVNASWLAIQLRKFILFIDILYFRSILLPRLKREGCDIILSDRYFYDSVINILYLQQQKKITTDVNQHEPPHNNTLCLEQFIPKPDIALFLSVTPEEILKRERVPEQGLQYLKDKIALFEQKKASWHLVEIDASQPKEQVASSIIAVVFQMASADRGKPQSKE